MMQKEELSFEQACWIEDYVRKYMRSILKMLIYRVRDQSRAEDMLQEVFYRVMLFVDRLRVLDEEELIWYTRAIIQSVISDFYEKEKDELYASEMDLEQIAADYNTYIHPENHILNQDYIRLLDVLVPKYRDVVFLRIRYGMKFAEIGKSLGIKEVTARKRFERGKDLLVAKYGRNFWCDYLMNGV